MPGHLWSPVLLAALIILMSVATPTPGMAQAPTDDPLLDEIDKLDEELNSLDKTDPAQTDSAGKTEAGTKPEEAPPEKTILELADDAMLAGRLDEARVHLQGFLKENPEHAYALLSLARVEAWSGKNEEALVAYRRYLTTNPHDLDVYGEQSRLLYGQAKFDEAKAVARDIISVEQENIPATLVLAHSIYLTENKEDAEKLYKWVLTLDPENPDAHPPTGAQIPRAGGGSELGRYTLRSKNSLVGDSQDYLGFNSITGFRIALAGFLALEPQLLIAVLDDARTSPIYGAGGALKLTLNGSWWELWARGGYLPMLADSTTISGWLVDLGAAIKPVEGLSIWAEVGSNLHGLDRQSALSVLRGTRRNEVRGGLYYDKDRFRATVSASVGLVDGPGVDQSLNSSFWVSPELKIIDSRWQIYIGYGLWAMFYDQDPTDNEYWSPAGFLSHMLYLDAGVPLSTTWKFSGMLGGGFGMERVRQITAATPDAWNYAAAGMIKGEFTWAPNPAFEAGLGGGYSLSARNVPGQTTMSSYSSWEVVLNLIGRW